MKIRGKIDRGSIYVHSGGYNSTSGILLGVLALKANFTVNVVEPVDNKIYGYQMGNGSYTEAIGDVVRHKVVASFASFFVKRYANNDRMEFTTTVGFDEVCVITPRAGKIPKGLRMYRIFRWSVWLCIILSYVFAYLAWYYARLLESRSPKLKKLDGQRIALHTLLIISGYPIPFPATKSERCLLLGLFISSVTIIGVFNGALYTMFANNMHYKEIDTLEELDASGLPIGCTRNTKDIFGTENDVNLNPVRRRLQKKMVYARDSMEMAAVYRNVTSLLRKQHYTLLSGPLRGRHGEKLVHRMRECPVSKQRRLQFTEQ
ncbi:uncharacterized protein LOC105663757 [Megachile rotundata]|uniref:uncharacterized protein LOC105663757 n=1 Tax=Megachile rotundata TaxID=143995 RepID=UPI003FD57545